MYTQNNAPMVDQGALRYRLLDIQAQTRERYCKPKEDVERRTVRQADTAAEEPEVSSWEVVG